LSENDKELFEEFSWASVSDESETVLRLVRISSERDWFDKQRLV